MTDTYECIKTDFLVVGSGIAGLYTALKLSRSGHVQIITKNEAKESSTQYAQGGIAAVLDKGDSWELHMKDTLEAGDDFCDKDAVEFLVREGPDRVKELIELGTQFDFIEGELDLAKEGAHSRRRVLHARGDATGEEIRGSLTDVVRDNKNIELKERNFLIDFEVKDNKFAGAICWDDDKNSIIFYRAAYGILASGGCGMVYKNTTNPDVTTGDGVAVAYRAGADITDMEFIQFHPTALYDPDGVSFLISETVRGEGGILRNQDGYRFMQDHHEDAELAPRDVVARAMIDEMDKFGSDYIWLDVSHLDEKYLKGRFPKIYHKLQENDIDMAEDMIPVVPSAHYMIGGVKTDLNGRTSIERLYACGEVACNGVHGANRLASNSLLDGIVFGHRINEHIRNEGLNQVIEIENPTDVPAIGEPDIDVKGIRNDMRRKMIDDSGIIRNSNELLKLDSWLKDKLEVLESLNSWNILAFETKNMLRVGMLITRSALLREESRGAHYRSDFPSTKSKWKDKHTISNINNPKGYVK